MWWASAKRWGIFGQTKPKSQGVLHTEYEVRKFAIYQEIDKVIDNYNRVNRVLNHEFDMHSSK